MKKVIKQINKEIKDLEESFANAREEGYDLANEEYILNNIKKQVNLLIITRVVKSFYCNNMEEEGMLSCGDQCDFCKEHH